MGATLGTFASTACTASWLASMHLKHFWKGGVHIGCVCVHEPLFHQILVPLLHRPDDFKRDRASVLRLKVRVVLAAGPEANAGPRQQRKRARCVFAKVGAAPRSARLRSELGRQLA